MMRKVRKSLALLKKTYPTKKLVFLAGITLLELVMVVVVIGIIAAFTIPGYLGAKRKSEQRGASTQLRLVHTAEKVRHLESDSYVACAGYVACSTALNLDLPDDGWTYTVVCAGGCPLGFSATAAKDGCTYTITQALQKPTPAGCLYIP